MEIIKKGAGGQKGGGWGRETNNIFTWPKVSQNSSFLLGGFSAFMCNTSISQGYDNAAHVYFGLICE